MFPYIAIGLLFVAVVGVIGYLFHRHTPAVPSTGVTSTVLAGLPTIDDVAATVRQELAAVPAMVSGEVVRLQTELQAATERALAAETDAAQAKALHEADKESWASRVVAAVKSQVVAPPAAPPVVPPAAQPLVRDTGPIREV